jgi:two-component system, OmpR family, sensor kinase
MLDRLRAAFAGQQEFVADASHELRTPVTVIRGQLEVLAESPNPSPQELRRVEGILQTEVMRIDRLIEDLLLLAELEQADFLQMEEIELDAFLRELWGSTIPIAQRRFILGSIPSGVIEADPDRLAQALRNLLVNAIKHTSEDAGTVRLTAEPLGGGRLRFAVEDDGPGIPRAQRERVFDRFHRMDAARDRASGGSGLGLAIVKAIATAHGGVVSVDASSLGGARLSVELPRFRHSRDATRPTRASENERRTLTRDVSAKTPTG